MPEWQEWPEVGRKVYLRPKKKKKGHLVRNVWLTVAGILLFLGILFSCTVEWDFSYWKPALGCLGVSGLMFWMAGK